MRTFFPSCAEAARRISHAHDARLSFPERVGLRLHLAVCRFCRRYLRQVRFLRSVLRDYPGHIDDLEPERLSDDARKKIVSRLK